jgi:hypothetical protein
LKRLAKTTKITTETVKTQVRSCKDWQVTLKATRYSVGKAKRIRHQVNIVCIKNREVCHFKSIITD